MKKILSFTVLGLGLVGCADHDKDYIQQSNTIAPMTTTAGTGMKVGENYYPVPGKPNINQSTPPSLIPPGSHLQETSTETKNTTRAQLKTTDSGVEALVISGNLTTAWNQVNKALPSTPYRLLDQDRSMSSFYILDLPSTNNQLTRGTPIYRLYLQSAGDNVTQVTVLDQKNKPLSPDLQHQILSALQQGLS